MRRHLLGAPQPADPDLGDRGADRRREPDDPGRPEDADAGAAGSAAGRRSRAAARPEAAVRCASRPPSRSTSGTKSGTTVEQHGVGEAAGGRDRVEEARAIAGDAAEPAHHVAGEVLRRERASCLVRACSREGNSRSTSTTKRRRNTIWRVTASSRGGEAHHCRHRGAQQRGRRPLQGSRGAAAQVGWGRLWARSSRAETQTRGLTRAQKRRDERHG